MEIRSAKQLPPKTLIDRLTKNDPHRKSTYNIFNNIALHTDITVAKAEIQIAHFCSFISVSFLWCNYKYNTICYNTHATIL